MYSVVPPLPDVSDPLFSVYSVVPPLPLPVSVCRLLLVAAGVKADNKRQDNVSFQTSVHYLVGAYLPHLTPGTGDLQPTRQGPEACRVPGGGGRGMPPWLRKVH